MQTPVEMVDIMMSSTRLYEALKLEVRRLQALSPNAMTAEEEALVLRWNRHAAALGAKLEREAKLRQLRWPAAAFLF